MGPDTDTAYVGCQTDGQEHKVRIHTVRDRRPPIESALLLQIIHGLPGSSHFSNNVRTIPPRTHQSKVRSTNSNPEARASALQKPDNVSVEVGALVERNRPYPRSCQLRPGPLGRLRRGERRRHRDPTAVPPPGLLLADSAEVRHPCMRVAIVGIVRVQHVGRRCRQGAFPREEGAEEEVLHNGEFAEDLSKVHLDEARVDLVPGLDLF